MALELAFTCSRTLEGLRREPLGDAVDGFCQWLQDRGFSRHSQRKHVSNVGHLNDYLREQGLGVGHGSWPDHVEDFLQAYPSRCRARGSLAAHVRRVTWSIHRFMAYVVEAGLVDGSRKHEPFQALLDEYLEWMKDLQHAAPGTLDVRAQSLREFLVWLGPDATGEGVSRLSAERVEAFFLAYAESKGRAARRSMQSALRTFLRFCLWRGHLAQPLDGAVPTLRTYKLASVPRGLTDEQAQQVLDHIDRETASGRRDYAIVQLLYTYGVRGGQIRALCLKDVHWAENQILFRASKHGKDARLPLTPEVGESLLDYLQLARPTVAYPEIFLTCRAPYHPLPKSNTLSQIVRSRIQAAGIDLPSRGAHVFRHGFATRMLRQGHDLKAIADVLGHRHLGATFIYAKVDVAGLEQVALEWPEGVPS